MLYGVLVSLNTTAFSSSIINYELCSFLVIVTWNFKKNKICLLTNKLTNNLLKLLFVVVK